MEIVQLVRDCARRVSPAETTPFMRRLARCWIICIAAAMSIIASPATSHAAIFAVTTSAIDAHDANVIDGLCNDGAGNCTLRAAIEQADKLGGVNTINVPPGTYMLTAALGPLTTFSGINTLLTISGNGAPGSVIIDAQNATTVITLGGNTSSFILDNLVIQNGKFTVADPGGFGQCVGAGINVISNVTVTLSNSVVRNNTVVNGSGAGICINFGTFTIDRSAVRDNTATHGGGGIRITSGAPPGKLIITNSTISGNVVTGDGSGPGSSQGGGIISQATIDMRNSTMSGNVVTGYASALLTTSNAKTTMTNVTVSGNSGVGGQIALSNGDLLTLESTIIANPTGADGFNCANGGTYVSNGHNLDSGNTCRMIAASDLTNINPSLGPLQNNGGRTETHALLSGSIAIDRGSNPLAFVADQRGPGFARVSGAAVDIGAFEFQGANGVPTLDIDASNAATKYDALTDGLLTLRYLFGLTGGMLTQSALGATPTRTGPVAVKGYLDEIRNALDIDGNGTPDASTDGLLILRYLFGLRGNALVANALAGNATRTTPAAIEAQIALLMP